MCLVCGDLVGELHWTERNLRRPGDGDSSAEADRRQARFRRTRVLNRVLALYHLSVHEDLSATRYVISDGKGGQEVVGDLDQLWAAAERLAHTSLDPLDHRLLDRMDAERNVR